MSAFDKLAFRIDEPMREQFRQFVETGEASEDFLNYLDSNAQAQAVVEEAFDAQAAALVRVAKIVNEESEGDLFAAADPITQAVDAVGVVTDNLGQGRQRDLEKFATAVLEKSGVEGARRVQSTLNAVLGAFPQWLEEPDQDRKQETIG